ncbi:DUF1572 family protein [Pedobacter sp. Hv1]|uniref:DUF1572 family protein n=1 Tax=Pedobacter sp. Hv1 TaxID=1740090 RepID=UPI0006D89586|nr:DUF1572 family protein [Pedobacter sp. Hv1]KQC02530.1 DinB superfamily protein [Pedobacter sp. Hv1]
MLAEALKSIFVRDLQKLKQEIASYKNEEVMWLIEESISNSAGNLCLHLIGNLNAYIGVGLAKTAYIRNRELEFSLKNIPRATLIERIKETIIVVENGLDNLSDEQMKGNFPIVIWEKESGMMFTLIHLTTHLNYHLGQINYHRRLLDK